MEATMGSLSSGDAIAIVVPGHFICAGILLYTAVVAAMVGGYRARRPLYLAFAATCLTSALAVVARASYYLSDSLAGGVETMRWSQHGIILFSFSLLVFIAIYTHSRVPPRAYALIGVLGAVFLAANQFLPRGIRFSDIEGFGYTYLPWGEAIFRLEGAPGAWNAVFRGLIVLALMWSVTRLVAQHRAGQRREALTLGAYLLVLFLTGVQGALIDWGIVRSFHWAGFALVGLALLMGIHLLVDLSQQNQALAAGAEELRAENERRRAAEAQIRERAYRDSLTGLPNRMFVLEHIAGTLERGHPSGYGAVLLCDLDHFKVINDALSEDLGDQVLCEIARRVSAASKGRAVVARMGGDEFIAILDALSRDEAEANAQIRTLAADISRALSQPLVLGDQALNVFASMGIAVFPATGTTARDVVTRVDMALHAAKRRGRNNIQAFLPSLQQQAERKHRVIEGLKQAIVQGELALHYQPQVDRAGRMTGAEALLRWGSARLGPVAPAEFIALAEEAGLIHALGDWSLQRACQDLAAWKRSARGFDGHLSVNVSPWQLARPDFVPRLREIMSSSGIDPHALMLEITESALLYDVKETIAKLDEVRPLGVQIALDDFGTGYSSLSLLNELPVDALKIDQSFVRGIAEGPNAHLVRMLVAVGTELGLSVIAEGVETESECKALIALGCGLFQGYLFSRPLPEPEFRAFDAGAGSAAMLAADVRV
jgi:diguanylate cyclase (GGDEF)-like protein